MYALQDITRDSQLGISDLNPCICVYERVARRKELKKSFGFDCQCYICLKEEVGSEYWLLDQQKQSLIAPWSLDMADKVIKGGNLSVKARVYIRGRRVSYFTMVLCYNTLLGS